MPVYIPNQEDYFKDSFAILQLSLESIFATVHDKTFITVVNNGSCDEVTNYLNQISEQYKIHEIIHTESIGKLNSILKGLAGTNIELVTITDADVLFLPNWQNETVTIFKEMPKVGVVGIVPQFNMFKANCENVIFDNLFSDVLQFIPVKSREGLINFYKSIGWDEHYNKDFLEYGLGLKYEKTAVYVGSGHFVATYKKQMFDQIPTYFDFKLGGNSESYLDTVPLNNDYWRVTTYDSYGYHMGNVLENWMYEIKFDTTNRPEVINARFPIRKPSIRVITILKRRFVKSFLLNSLISKWFYSYKKLPKQMVRNYNTISSMPKSPL
jgi:hypothetical protein